MFGTLSAAAGIAIDTDSVDISFSLADPTSGEPTDGSAPATLSLLCLGLVTLGYRRRKR